MSGTLCALLRGMALGGGSQRAALIGSAAATTTAAAITKSTLLAQPRLNQVLLDQIRLRSMRASRRIRGYPRPLVKGVVRPEPMKYGYRLIKPDEYTTDLVRLKKLAGRHPETGRVVVRTIGGGYQKWAHWVDFRRDGPEDGVFEEKVYKIEDDSLQTAKCALVAHGDKKRWIIATEGVQVGQVIATTRHLPRLPVRPRVGDGHPLGALPIGTQVHCVEHFPGQGAQLCRAAGASARLIRKVAGRAILHLTNGRQVAISEKCLAIVGQVSNADRMTTFYPIGSPNRLRRLGRRPHSGFWHRKDGYCGRKVRRPPPIVIKPLARPRESSQYVL